MIRCVSCLLVWMERWGCHIYSAALNCVIGRRRGGEGCLAVHETTCLGRSLPDSASSAAKMKEA